MTLSHVSMWHHQEHSSAIDGVDSLQKQTGQIHYRKWFSVTYQLAKLLGKIFSVQWILHLYAMRWSSLIDWVINRIIKMNNTMKWPSKRFSIQLIILAFISSSSRSNSSNNDSVQQHNQRQTTQQQQQKQKPILCLNWRENNSVIQHKVNEMRHLSIC